MAALVGIPSNPVPRHAVCATVTSSDGVELRYARFPSNRSPVRGTVIILHGRSEFIEKYFEVVNDLRRRGFAVVVFDARGQGGSSRLLKNRMKGYVRDFADYVNDFETIMQDVVLPDCPPPYFALAHSMGGTVALLSAERLRTQIERMVLTAPLCGLRHAGPLALARVSGAANFFGLGTAYVPGLRPRSLEAQPFEGNVLTSDPDRYARSRAVVVEEPALAVGPPTIGWVNAAMRAAARISEPEFAAQIPIPVLMVLAGVETVVDNGAAETLSRRCKTIAHLRIPGARHEILMERNDYRDQFWVAFDAFIQGRA